MKHFLSLLVIAISFSAIAQNPNYDPDSNGDNFIGTADLVTFLTVFNSVLQPDSLNIVYVSELDTVGFFNDAPLHKIPSYAHVVLTHPDHVGDPGFVLLEGSERQIVLLQGSLSQINLPDSIKSVTPQSAITTYIFVDGKWWILF